MLPENLQHLTKPVACDEKEREKDRERGRDWRARNPEKARESVRRWKAKNPEKARESARRWRAENLEKAREIGRMCRYVKYGITTVGFDAMFTQQGGVCGICKRKRPLCVDHNHETKKVRALLCRKCNSGIGFFQEDFSTLIRAADYIRRHDGGN